MGIGRSVIVFDIDGTLVDSQSSLICAYELTCDFFHLEALTRGFSNLLGGTLEHILETLHPGATVAEMAKYFREIAHRKAPLPDPFPCAVDLVETATRLSDYCAYITNKDHLRAEALLEALGFPKLQVLSPSQGFRPKPETEMFEVLLKQTDANFGLYLGDTEEDFRASTSAGFDFIHCAWGYGRIPPEVYFETCGDALAAKHEILNWVKTKPKRRL